MAAVPSMPSNKPTKITTGKRQPDQTKPLPPLPSLKHKSSLIINKTTTNFSPPTLRLKDVDLHKLTLNLPNRQQTGKWFSHLPSPAGLFSTLTLPLRRTIFSLAVQHSEPLVIHAYRDEGNKLAHGPYVKRRGDSDSNSSNGRNLSTAEKEREKENVLALTRVSKAIRYETHFLFYQLNTIYLNHDPDFRGNDARSILEKFRMQVGEEAFQRIQNLGFCCQVRKERVSRILWPRSEIASQVVEAVKRCVAALSEIDCPTQEMRRWRWGGEVRLEICLEGLMKGPRREGKAAASSRYTAGQRRARIAASKSFSMRIQLDLGLPTCMWDRHLAKWVRLADEAEGKGDLLRARGLREVVKEMRRAEGKLERVLPVQRRI
ncbi:hypothetical protein BST61_g3196 [Cercospora zeina]